jgi:hypothetical protein
VRSRLIGRSIHGRKSEHRTVRLLGEVNGQFQWPVQTFSKKMTSSKVHTITMPSVLIHLEIRLHATVVWPDACCSKYGLVLDLHYVAFELETWSHVGFGLGTCGQ